MDDLEKIRNWVAEARLFLEKYDIEHKRDKKLTADDFYKENEDDRTECE